MIIEHDYQMEIRDATMHMLLHFNEDFDDDLLLDVIRLVADE